MKSKNKILESIEEFISEHVSIFKNRIIQITGFKSDFITSKSIDVDVSDNIIRINCVNNEGAYNLLSSVIYKRKILEKQRELKKKQENENQNSEIYNQRA